MSLSSSGKACQTFASAPRRAKWCVLRGAASLTARIIARSPSLPGARVSSNAVTVQLPCAIATVRVLNDASAQGVSRANRLKASPCHRLAISIPTPRPWVSVRPRFPSHQCRRRRLESLPRCHRGRHRLIIPPFSTRQACSSFGRRHRHCHRRRPRRCRTDLHA